MSAGTMSTRQDRDGPNQSVFEDGHMQDAPATHSHRHRTFLIARFPSMLMPVMNIREMGVRMGNGQMHVWVRMRLVPGISKFVFVLVMLVMAMPMGVREPLMRVFMLVPFAYVQPDAERHRGRSNPERHVRQFGPHEQRERHTE